MVDQCRTPSGGGHNPTFPRLWHNCLGWVIYHGENLQRRVIQLHPNRHSSYFVEQDGGYGWRRGAKNNWRGCCLHYEEDTNPAFYANVYVVAFWFGAPTERT